MFSQAKEIVNQPRIKKNFNLNLIQTCNISTAKLILSDKLKGPERVGMHLNQRNSLQDSYKKIAIIF